MRCNCVVHLSTVLDSFISWMEGLGWYLQCFSMILAGEFCNIEIDGWLGGASEPGDAEPDFSC